MNPITRKEYYLAKLTAQEVELPSPVTRTDIYLHFLATGEGTVEELPLPLSREDYYLYELCKNPPSGGGSGSGGGFGEVIDLNLQCVEYEKL